MILEQLITNFENALPGGFSADWTQDFSDGDKVYYTCGPDWTVDIPDSAEEAREAAAKYTESVTAAIQTAQEHERRAIQALKLGDINAAHKAMQAAAREERAFGDCTDYWVALEILEHQMYSPGEFTTPPECSGQIVLVSYGLDADRDAVIVRQQDGGDGLTSYTAYQLPEEWDGEWAPWNGTPTLGAEIGPCGIKA